MGNLKRRTTTPSQQAKAGEWRPLPKAGFFRDSHQRARKATFWWQTTAQWKLYALGTALVSVSVTAYLWPLQSALVAAVIAVVVGRLLMVRRERRVRMEHVWEMVQPHLGLPAGFYPEAADWVTLPGDLKAKDARVRIELPPGFAATGDRKQAIADAVSGALPGTWEAKWHVKYTDLKTSWIKEKLMGAKNHDGPHVTFVHPPEPPDQVKFSDPEVIERFEAGPEHLVPIGRDNRNRWVEIDINGDSPHIAYSGGTGAGKSTTLRGIVAYLLRHGAKSVDIIDPKRISLTRPFGTNPRVRIHKSVPAQWDAMEAFHAEMLRRYAWAEGEGAREFGDEEAALESLERRVLVIEEGGSFFDLTKTEWKNEREKEDPTEAPALTQFRHILFQGRQAKMTVLLVVQQGNARDMGGSAARDQFAAKILVRYSRQVWMMVVGTTPVPSSPDHKGRGYVVTGDKEIRTQLILTTSEEAKEFAAKGDPEPVSENETQTIVQVDDSVSDPRTHLHVVQDNVQDTTEKPSPAQTPDQASQAPVWLSKTQVCERLQMSESAFDKWRQRTAKELADKNQEFPEGKRIKNRIHWSENEVDQIEILRKGDAA